MMMAVYQVVRGRRVASRGVGSAVPRTLVVGTRCGYAVRSIGPVLRCLDHWWQLQLLVVGIVALISSVTFPIAENLLVQLYHLVRLVVAAAVGHVVPRVRLVLR